MSTTVSGRGCSLVIVLLAFSLPALAQTNPAPLRLVAVHAQPPEQVEALVELPDGVTAVEAADFQLLEDSRPTVRAIARDAFRASNWTLAAVLAIDTSGSVRRHMPAITEALPPFVEALPKNDAVALVTFDDAVHPVAPFGTPRDRILISLQDLRPRGNRTLLYDALNQGLEILKPGEARARRRIIVVSDGADESSVEANSTDRIIERAIGLGVAIDTIWIGQPVASTRNTMVRLAERTGGIHTDAVDPKTVADNVRTALARVTTRVDGAVVLRFDRQVQGAAVTREVGVALNRAGVASSVMAFQMPQSVVPDQGSTVSLWLILALAALGLYALYAAIYLIVRSYFPDRVDLFPFVPWPFPAPLVVIDLPPIAPVTLPPPPPRRTLVQRGGGMVMDPVSSAEGVLLLEAIAGPLKGDRIRVDRTNFQVGAGTNNDLRIDSDTYLSGSHALFQMSSGQWQVLDQDSRNGTFLDGKKVAVGRGHALRDGQVVRMGASEFKVVLGDAQASFTDSPR